jgi:hypothetical protein
MGVKLFHYTVWGTTPLLTVVTQFMSEEPGNEVSRQRICMDSRLRTGHA